MSSSIDVLDAVRRLLEEPQFQDVHFVCSDGRTVSSNRSFLAARCEYFERLLFGNLKESSCSEIQLHASSEAVRHVLVHLHTGGFTSIEQEACWITLMEASSLAQQYILPGMVQHVADRLSADLSPQNLGLALSHALKVDLFGELIMASHNCAHWWARCVVRFVLQACSRRSRPYVSYSVAFVCMALCGCAGSVLKVPARCWFAARTRRAVQLSNVKHCFPLLSTRLVGSKPPVLAATTAACCCCSLRVAAVKPCLRHHTHQNTPQADLQAVIKSIWVALPRLLQQPFTLDRSFSADAICF